MGPIVHDPKSVQPEKMKEVATAEDMSVDAVKLASMMGPSTGRTKDMKHFGVPNTHFSVTEPGASSHLVFVPEGRVHGGSLMAMLAGGSGVGSSSNQGRIIDPSDQRNSNVMLQSWI